MTQNLQLHEAEDSTQPLSGLLGSRNVPKNRENDAKYESDFYLISFQFLQFSGDMPWLSAPTISSNLVKKSIGAEL